MAIPGVVRANATPGARHAWMACSVGVDRMHWSVQAPNVLLPWGGMRAQPNPTLLPVETTHRTEPGPRTK
jgi:hypothetical protein